MDTLVLNIGQTWQKLNELFPMTKDYKYSCQFISSGILYVHESVEPPLDNEAGMSISRNGKFTLQLEDDLNIWVKSTAENKLLINQDSNVLNVSKTDWVLDYLDSIYQCKNDNRLVKNKLVINKFGKCSSMPVTGGTIWEGADPGYKGTAVYTYTVNTGANYYFSSTNTNDNQAIQFYVLTVDSNGNWNREVFIQNINGQTKTLLTPPSGNPVVRISRAINIGSSYLLGNLYVYEDDTVIDGEPQTDNKVRLIITVGNDQTLMSLDTIPTGYVGFLFQGETGLQYEAGPVATAYSTIKYKSKAFGSIFNVKKEISLITTGSSNYRDERKFPEIIPAKTDFQESVEESSAVMGVYGTFDIILIPEENLNDEFLTKIGQIRRVS